MTPADLAVREALLLHQQQLLGPLLQIVDPQARLARLVEHARQRPSLPPDMRDERHRLEGCLVRIWFVPDWHHGRCHFQCDSDAVSLKAVGGLLCQLYDGFTPAEILAAPNGVLGTLCILHQLAENRQRTLARIEEKIRDFARQQQALA